VKENHCVRIFTGAQLPTGADTVLLQENVNRLENSIKIEDSVDAGANVRQIGHDVALGNLLLPAKSCVNNFSQAWLTACGISEVQTFAKPKIALFSTGDELKNVGEPLLPGQIYDGNRIIIKSLLAHLPVEIIDLGIIADDQESIEQTITTAAQTVDAIITSGGVSVGEADFVRQALEARGSLGFWKLNLKPGKPFAYGQVGDHCHFFGLPGNPISTIITLLLIVKPALQQLCGGNLQRPIHFPATANNEFLHSRGRDEYQRGRYLNIPSNGHSELRVETTGDQSSNRFSSFNKADCLVWIEKDRGSVEPGEKVNTLPLANLIF
jgi:molybdopterin molybdotransferase